MKYWIRLRDGSCFRDCRIRKSGFPGFIEVAPDDADTRLYNTDEIRAIFPEAGNGAICDPNLHIRSIDLGLGGGWE